MPASPTGSKLSCGPLRTFRPASMEAVPSIPHQVWDSRSSSSSSLLILCMWLWLWLCGCGYVVVIVVVVVVASPLIPSSKLSLSPPPSPPPRFPHRTPLPRACQCRPTTAQLFCATSNRSSVTGRTFRMCTCLQGLATARRQSCRRTPGCTRWCRSVLCSSDQGMCVCVCASVCVCACVCDVCECVCVCVCTIQTSLTLSFVLLLLLLPFPPPPFRACTTSTTTALIVIVICRWDRLHCDTRSGA